MTLPANKLDDGLGALDSAEIAASLGCSRRHAVELMPEMGAVDISREGSRRALWRVPKENFYEWLERKAAPATASGSAGASTGRASGARGSRRGAKTVRLRASRAPDSSERPPILLPRSHGKLP